MRIKKQLTIMIKKNWIHLIKDYKQQTNLQGKCQNQGKKKYKHF